MTMTDTRCGTIAGHGRHRRRKETACEPCRTANLEYNRSWRKANPAKLKEYDRRDYEKNREQIILKARAWRKANPDKVNASTRAFHEAHPEFMRRRVQRRRARRLNNGVERYTEAQVLELYGTNCALCSLPIDLTAPRTCRKAGWQYGLHIDHVIPISKGGPDTLANVQPTHALCNVRKGGKA